MGYNTKFITTRFNSYAPADGEVVYDVELPDNAGNARFVFLDPSKLSFRQAQELKATLGMLRALVAARRNQSLCRPLMDACERTYLHKVADPGHISHIEICEKLTKMFNNWLGGNYLPFIVGDVVGCNFSVGQGGYQAVRKVWIDKQLQLLS